MGLLDRFKKNNFDGVYNPVEALRFSVQTEENKEALAIHEKYSTDKHENPIFNKKNVYYWHIRGKLLSKLNRLEESLKCYQKALEINDSYTKSWYEIGKIYFESGNFVTAREAFSEAIRIEEDITNKSDWRNLCMFYFVMSQYTEWKNTHDEKHMPPSHVINTLRNFIRTDSITDGEFLNMCYENFQQIVYDYTQQVIDEELRFIETKWNIETTKVGKNLSGKDDASNHA